MYSEGDPEGHPEVHLLSARILKLIFSSSSERSVCHVTTENSLKIDSLSSILDNGMPSPAISTAHRHHI